MSQNQIRTFLADDHSLFREGLVALLEKDPEIVVIGQCGDGLQVLPLLDDLLPDVIILDISLPGLNGLDICKEITRKYPEIAVLILSMHVNDECVRDAVENGAAGYMCKDSPSASFTHAIHSVARGELYFGPGISRDVLKSINMDRQDPYQTLTHRERQVLQLVAEGKTNKEIANTLSITFKTVDTHRTNLMQKLDIHNQTELVKYAIRRKLVSLD